MNKVFNTPFENSLRVLLLLSIYDDEAITIDMITSLDFIAVNGKTLGISDFDLHGKNAFSLCEYASRRELISIAIKELVIRGLITIDKRQNGLCYKISNNGITIANGMNTDYSQEYLDAVLQTKLFAKNKNERTLIAFINKQTAKRTGEPNE